MAWYKNEARVAIIKGKDTNGKKRSAEIWLTINRQHLKRLKGSRSEKRADVNPVVKISVSHHKQARCTITNTWRDSSTYQVEPIITRVCV